jgi:hypothetical protein
MNSGKIRSESDESLEHVPMMQQCLRIRAQQPDLAFCYRMRDFFEMLYDDPRRAAQSMPRRVYLRVILGARQALEVRPADS